MKYIAYGSNMVQEQMAFRCPNARLLGTGWLLRLGFIGDEFETARTHLLANLPGNAAWRQAS